MGSILVERGCPDIDQLEKANRRKPRNIPPGPGPSAGQVGQVRSPVPPLGTSRLAPAIFYLLSMYTLFNVLKPT